jgi:hypothetical protein
VDHFDGSGGLVSDAPTETQCRAAYLTAGWTYYWPYESIPGWLKPAWHHTGPATEVRRQAEERTRA